MAQDKRVFTGGMDKDSDPRLIKDGDYRDALNIRNIASMDSTSGSVENLEGNTLVPFTFIDEVDQTLEFTSSSNGQIVVDEVPIDQVFRSQQIIISGKEEVGDAHMLEIFYQTVTENPDGSLSLNDIGSIDSSQIMTQGFGAQPGLYTSEVGLSNSSAYGAPFGTTGESSEWYGNTNSNATTYFIQNVFGQFGSWRVLNVQDYTTGQLIQIEVDSIVTASGENMIGGMNFNNVEPITITYRSLTPNAYFLLNFQSTFSVVTNQLWSDTVNSITPNGSLSIGIGQQMFLGSSIGFITMDPEIDGVNFNVDDENTVYSNGLPIGTTGATWDLDIEGDEPTNPSITPDADNNVNLYTYEVFDTIFGDFFDIDVSEFFPIIDIIPETGSGGGFTFDDDQVQFSNVFTNIVKQPSDVGPVIVTGGGGIVSTPSGVSTNFLPSTPLTGKNRSLQRNTSPSLKTYNQLEYYYNSDEVVEAPGFTINEGTLTFAGSDIVRGELYLLKAPIIKDKDHKLTYDVSGLPVGNSFSFEIFNNVVPGATADGSGEAFFKSTVNYAYIYIKFQRNFSATDSMTITNLRLLLEKTEVDKLTIRFQSSLGIDFNLGFATSEEDLREKLRQGIDVTKVPSWYPGTSLTLTKRNVGNQDNVNVVDSFEYQDLNNQLLAAQEQIANLNNQINHSQNHYSLQLAELNAQLDINSADAAAALNTAQLTNDALTSEISGLQQSLSSLENIIIDIGDPTSQADITDLIIQYDSDKDDVNNSLNNIVVNLASLDTSLIAQFDLYQQVTTLDGQLSDAQQQVAQLQDQIFIQDHQIINLTSTVDRLDKIISDNAIEISELQSEVSSLTDQLSIAQSQIDRLSAANSQLESLISDEENLNFASEELIQSLTDKLSDAVALIESQENTIESQDGDIISLNDSIDRLDNEVAHFQNQLSLQTISSLSSQANLQDNIISLQQQNLILTNKLNDAQSTINSLETSPQASEAYILLQSQFNNLQASYTNLELDFNNLDFHYSVLLNQFNTSQENQDDGITQDDVDSAFNAGIASVDVYNIISEHEQLNNTIVGTEKITNGDFKDPVTQWSGSNWVFQNGHAIANFKEYGEAGSLSQSVNLDAGKYLLKVNALKIEGTTLEVLFISEKDRKVVLRQKIDARKNTPLLIDLPKQCTSVLFALGKSNKYEVVIEEISLSKFTNDGSVTANLIMELLAFINQVDAGNQNLQNTILDQKAVILKLQNELEQAREDIEEYVSALQNAVLNIGYLGSVIIEVISDLGVSSNITSQDITDFTNSFNSDQLDLNEMIDSQSSLINSLVNLLNEVDGSSIPSSVGNEKWLLTISGGLPVLSETQQLIGSHYIVIRNVNIPDLQLTNNTPNPGYGSSFLENSGFKILDALFDDSNRRSNFFGNSVSQSTDSEFIILKEVNEASNRVNYNTSLERWVDGETYDGNPNTFYRTFYSPSTSKSYTIKFTFHNFQPRNMVVDTNGNPYTTSSIGDKIVGNRGGQRPLHTSTGYLEAAGITDGLQIEIEFLGGETGWEIYNLYQSLTDTYNEIKMNSQSSIALFVNNTYDFNYNISNPTDPNYVAEGGVNISLHVEKIQQSSSPAPRNSIDGVDSFVEALTIPSYDGQDLNSNRYMYPSASSDIIMNKSQDVEPDLSGNLLGAKRISKNKI